MITNAEILLETFRVRLDTGCNMRCFFCDSWHDRPVKISADCIRVGLNAARNNGAERIAVSGGEPLISTCLIGVLEGVCDLGLPTHLTTNGTLLEEKATLLAKSGVRTIHLSVETTGRKTRLAGGEQMDATKARLAINAARDAGMDVEINQLVLRDLNWGVEELQRTLDFCVANDIGLNLLDLLYTWNPSLERFHVPYAEIREAFEYQIGLNGEVVAHSGRIQTRYSYRNISIWLRDFRAVPSPALCPACSTERATFGVTSPQLSTEGTIGICRHTRKAVGESEREVEESVGGIFRRVWSGGEIKWVRS